MKFMLGCQLAYELSTNCTFIFNISVAQTSNQQILAETLKIEPNLEAEEYKAPLLENRYLRVNAPPGRLKISYQATVEVQFVETQPQTIPEIPVAELPLEVLHYLYPSRYCESDRLMRLAHDEFGELIPDYSRVTAICNWIYDNVAYLSGSTNQQTSAFDTVTERAGVCRDFAHLGITFCRALNIPARFTSGYAYQLEPPDFHAYFEAYLGDRWYIFDATRLAPQNGLIRIGTGRDAADVAFATIFGSATLQDKNVFVEALLENSTGETETPDYTIQAVGT